MNIPDPVAPSVRSKTPVRKVFRHRYIQRLQRRHFFLFDVIPLCSILLLIPFWAYLKPGVVDLSLLVAGWFLTGLGVTVGLHRYFTHKSFKTSKPVAFIFAALGMMAVVGTTYWWVGIHRRHHELSDQEGDPHSPHLHGSGFWGSLKGFVHAQIGWLAGHDYPNPNHYVKDWLREHWLVRINRHYMLFVLAGLLIPAGIAFIFEPTLQAAVRGFFWGGIVRIAAVHHIVSAINSFCHLVGTRRFNTAEHSTNLSILAIPTLGESFHNNHHAFQTSATFSHRWWEIDIGAITIRAMEAVGLVWNVRRPHITRPQKAAEKSAAPTSPKP